MKGATAVIIHDTRRAKSGDKYPVKLRAIYNRVVKYYPTKYNLSKDDYAKLYEEKPDKKSKDIRDDLFKLLSKANDIIDKLPVFNFKIFANRLFKISTSKDDLIHAYNNYIGVLRLAGRISTAISYECSLKSLQKFKDSLKFEDITIEFLRDYEKWMLKEGNSLTTVGIYLRSLRSVYNESISDENISKESYPFGKRKYQIPTSRNTKKALLLSDIKKIYDYKPSPGSNIEMARDLWLFSYLCNGINIKDIARIKYKNIDGDYLTFLRAKTERATRSNPKPISIYLNDRAREIIKKWGNKRINADNYIFPIIEKGCTPENELRLIQQLIKTINKWMKFISEETKIEKVVTTYTARHSFSTVLKRSGASIEFISEALGHSNVRTTESYLDSFENESKKKYALTLTEFKNEIDEINQA
ncbi:phage integrase SAM-like domain-containing protein [Pedobacter sp.]|jgi:integrase/recombinase XerD|uniref:phage integrase SAM-like domain-containing protein n=1 Tax=Pedobacter sp. TaxID=1411316 RepID=UPI002C344EB6|nr:phage integrase SAM-like domain-containing protein [Pedobacter sp.]HWW41412.1 phage integrase SAM-like domain-containing protein [Pedobacter sp.]